MIKINFLITSKNWIPKVLRKLLVNLLLLTAETTNTRWDSLFICCQNSWLWFEYTLWTSRI